MADEKKPGTNKKNTAVSKSIQKRITDLYPSSEEFPASISIGQADKLLGRIQELEARLAEQEGGSDGETVTSETGEAPAEIKTQARRQSTTQVFVKPAASKPLPLHSLPTGLGKAITAFSDRIRRVRLQTRLTVFILFITIPLLLGLAAFISTRAGDEIETRANLALQNNEHALATNVSTWLELHVRTLNEMALLPNIVSMDAALQRPDLLAIASAHPNLFLVHTADLNGMNVARNDDSEPKDYSDRAWFLGAKAGAPITYEVLISRTTNRPALNLSTPIYDQFNHIIGVASIVSELDEISREILDVETGRGITYIVDANNRVVAYPDPAYTDTELRDLSEYPPVAALRQGQTGLITFTDENGVTWRAYVSALDNGWGIVAQQPETEILAPVRQFQTIASLAIMIGTILMLVLSWFTIRRMLQPIGSLTEAVSAIAAGDLNRTVEVKSQDEIGVLATTFNTMTSQLRDMISGLEQRVEDRTHDLELASEVGRAVTEKVANLQDMLTEAVETIRGRFNLYYTQVYLTDASGRSIVLRAGTGEVGKQLLARGHRLLISPGSLNGRAVTEKRTIIVADTTQSANFLPNPSLPNTRSEMVVPLIVAGQTIGALDMQSETPGALNETNQPAFEALAGQLSIAIQNANLFAENYEARKAVEASAQRSTESGWQEFLNGIERSERIGYVYEQNKQVELSDAPEAASKNTLSIPIKITGATVGSIQNIEEDRVWTARDRQITEATSAQLARHIESLRLLAQSERYRNDAEQAVRRLTREGWEAYLQARKEITPGYAFDMKSVQPLGEHGTNDLALTSKRTLTVRDESIGELAVETGSGFGESVEILDAVARQLSSHLENLRLSEQNEKRAYDLATVATVSTTASTVLNPDELLQAVVDLTKTRFNVYHAHVYLADESWKTLLLSAGAGEVGREMVAEQHAIPLDAEKSLVARAARERKAVIVNDVRSDPDFLPNVHLPDTRAEMAVPMIVGDKLLGVFDVQSEAANRFTEEDANIYTTLAAQVGVALQNARLYVEQAATVTQLRELDRLKSSFLANMSHELRTPLNSILGFADVILEELDGPLTENMHTDLGLIQKNGQHLLHLINDVLDMAKIEAGKMNLALEKFNLQDTIEEVTSITSPFASEKNLSLFIDPDSDNDLEIFADRTRLRQVMINLVNNSIKFTEKGKISIHVERQDENALIKVKDTGIGIAPDLLESIFQEFVQVDTSSTRKVGGTGLGLPISRRLISMHGGRLWAESTGVSGEGSTFFVLLPLEAKVTETELDIVK